MRYDRDRIIAVLTLVLLISGSVALVHATVMEKNQSLASRARLFSAGVDQVNQEKTVQTSILENGDFESGLSGWQAIDSGIGQSAVSRFIRHLGNSSLLLDLRPTSMLLKADVQGVLQPISIQNLRGLVIEAWYFTRSCSFPEGSIGRLQVQVGNLTTRYDAPATCGTWLQIARNVTADFQSEFGEEGLVPFQQSEEIRIVVSLQLVRSGTSNAMALSEYVSIHWDDAKAIATIPIQSTIETVESTTITTSETTTSVETGERTATVTSSSKALPVTPLAFGLGAEQFYIVIGVLSAVFALSIALFVRSTLKKDRSAAVKGPVVKICPKCRAKIPPYSDVRYCQECGIDLLHV